MVSRLVLYTDKRQNILPSLTLCPAEQLKQLSSMLCEDAKTNKVIVAIDRPNYEHLDAGGYFDELIRLGGQVDIITDFKYVFPWREQESLYAVGLHPKFRLMKNKVTLCGFDIVDVTQLDLEVPVKSLKWAEDKSRHISSMYDLKRYLSENIHTIEESNNVKRQLILKVPNKVVR